jgi:hypothetical protein
MKEITMKAFFTMALFIFSIPAIAGTQLAPQTIKKIGMGWGEEGVYITTNENLIAEGCVNTVAKMPSDHTMLKENLSVLLSAFHTNETVRLYVDGCIGDYMYLKAVSLEK